MFAEEHCLGGLGGGGGAPQALVELLEFFRMVELTCAASAHSSCRLGNRHCLGEVARRYSIHTVVIIGLGLDLQPSVDQSTVFMSPRKNETFYR